MPGCVAVKTAKYKARPSPPYHAGDCKGKTLKGNDGRKYKSVSDARGVYKWVSVSAGVSTSVEKVNKTRKALGKAKGKPAGTCYEIHDNRSTPYIACVES